MKYLIALLFLSSCAYQSKYGPITENRGVGYSEYKVGKGKWRVKVVEVSEKYNDKAYGYLIRRCKELQKGEAWLSNVILDKYYPGVQNSIYLPYYEATCSDKKINDSSEKL